MLKCVKRSEEIITDKFFAKEYVSISEHSDFCKLRCSLVYRKEQDLDKVIIKYKPCIN